MVIAIRKIWLLLICFTLPCADFDPPRQLTQDKHFFALRRELQGARSAASGILFYRGVA